jgi:hypothetical protein
MVGPYQSDQQRYNEVFISIASCPVLSIDKKNVIFTKRTFYPLSIFLIKIAQPAVRIIVKMYIGKFVILRQDENLFMKCATIP